MNIKVNILLMFSLVFFISCSPIKESVMNFGNKKTSIPYINIDEVCTPEKYLTKENYDAYVQADNTYALIQCSPSLIGGTYYGITGAVHSVERKDDAEIIIHIGDYYHKNNREFVCKMARDKLSANIQEGDRITLIGKFSGIFIDKPKTPLAEGYAIDFEDCFVLSR